MTRSSPSEEWNPKWLAFLYEEGLTTEQAEEMERPDRIKLNTKFMCWNVEKMTIETKRRFFS